MTANAKTLPGYDAALGTILAHVVTLGVEHVVLSEARGRVLREDVVADRDQPPFDRSTMDGFAARSTDIRHGETFVVSGSIPAGDPKSMHTRTIAPNTVVRIATGAPLPVGADAVIPNEMASVQTKPDGEQVVFNIDSVEPWGNVHQQSSDTRIGDVVLDAGLVLTPSQIGIAATVGQVKLVVSRQPRISLVTSGDEVRPPEVVTTELKPQQIRNSNGPMLRAFFAALGVPVRSHIHVPDDADATLAAAEEALAVSDLVVTVGGVSAGQRDYLPWTWSRLGLKTVIHGVAIQPGKPLLVATPRKSPRPRKSPSALVIGLPGNPVSVLATAHLFVWPVLAHAMGTSPPRWQMVRLNEPAKPNPRRQLFRAAALRDLGSASLIPWHGSGDLVHTTTADGWIRMPLQSEMVEEGTDLPFLPLVR